MDNLISDDKKYISALEAGKLIGVSRDYIGRLCRRSVLRGKRIGKFWIVDENSLKNYAYSAIMAKIDRRDRLVKARTDEYKGKNASGDVIQVPQGEEKRTLDKKILSLDKWHLEKPATDTLNFLHTQSRSPVTFSAVAQMIPPSTAHQFTDLLHRIISLITTFIVVFGSYAMIDNRFASFALGAFSETRIAIVHFPAQFVAVFDRVAIVAHSQQFATAISSDVSHFSGGKFISTTNTVARVVHDGVDTVVATVFEGVGDTKSVVEVEIVPLNVHQ